jgi:ribosomal protein L37AE/L43A
MKTYSEIARELLDFMRDCHSDDITDMPPDYHKYLFIVQSLNAIANSKGEDAPKYADCLGDSYTSNHDLCLWLASNTSRYLYCNKATDRNGQTKSTMQTLRNGYDLERELVFNKTVNYLTALLEQEEQNKNKGETDILCPVCGAKTEYRQRQGTPIRVCSECPMVMFEYYTEKDTHMLARELNSPKNQLIAKDVPVKQEKE